MAKDLCEKITLCFIKVRDDLIFCTSIGVHKKPSPRLSNNLYDPVYFDQWVRVIPGQISMFTCKLL